VSAAARRGVASPLQTFFLLFGGPLAWFLQLNADFALASNPCFFNHERAIAPHLATDWTGGAMLGIAVAAAAVAIAATATAGRAFSQSRDKTRDHELEAAAGRTRFLALWGICLAAGSALLIMVTAAVFFVLPRCAG
jgi:hypothetical protein